MRLSFCLTRWMLRLWQNVLVRWPAIPLLVESALDGHLVVFLGRTWRLMFCVSWVRSKVVSFLCCSRDVSDVGMNYLVFRILVECIVKTALLSPTVRACRVVVPVLVPPVGLNVMWCLVIVVIFL